jgi:protein-S-isoprenylcysteine O-methyltransferase Ste14
VSAAAPDTSSRLRLTYAFYLVLAIATATSGQPYLHPLVNQVIDILALSLVLTACLGRIWCSAFIGGYKNAALMMDGPYSVVRHPLYVFSLLGALGLGLTTHSIVATGVTAVFFVALFAGAARREDAYLKTQHPEQFASYARSTPRFWPRWRNYRVAEAITIKPAILRKSFFDAGAFILLYLTLDTLRVLRESGILPALYKLP